MNTKLEALRKAKQDIDNRLAEMEKAIAVSQEIDYMKNSIRKKFEIVLHDGTSKVYTSVKVACRDLDVSQSTLRRRLNDETINGIYNFSARYLN